MRPATVSRTLSFNKEGHEIALTWEEEPGYVPAASSYPDTSSKRPCSVLREGTVTLYYDESFEDSQVKLEGDCADPDLLTGLLHSELRSHGVDSSSVDQGLLTRARRSVSAYFENGPRGEEFLRKGNLPEFLRKPDDTSVIEDTRRWLTEESEQSVRLTDALQRVSFNCAPRPGEDPSRVFRISELPSADTVSANTIDLTPDFCKNRDAFLGLVDALSGSSGSSQAGCEAICRAAKGTKDVVMRPFSEYGEPRDGLADESLSMTDLAAVLEEYD